MAAGRFLTSSIIAFAFLRFVFPAIDQDIVTSRNNEILINLWRFCKPVCHGSFSNGQVSFRLRSTRDFTGINGVIVGLLLLLSGDIEIQPGPAATYNDISKLQDSTKLRGLKMAHQIIQSLSCKVDQLRILLLNDLKNELHILTLSETWAKRDLSDAELNIPGYKLFRKDRDGRNGGVAAFVRDDILVFRRDDLEVDSVEGLWLEVFVEKSRNFLLGTFYRPDSSSKYYDKEFLFKLENVLARVSVEGKEAILISDFNCCFMPSKRSRSDSKQLKSLFKSLSYKQLIITPTRICNDSVSLIDLIASNCPHNISDCGVISSHFSDHELVFCVRKLN